MYQSQVHIQYQVKVESWSKSGQGRVMVHIQVREIRAHRLDPSVREISAHGLDPSVCVRVGRVIYVLESIVWFIFNIQYQVKSSHINSKVHIQYQVSLVMIHIEYQVILYEVTSSQVISGQVISGQVISSYIKSWSIVSIQDQVMSYQVLSIKSYQSMKSCQVISSRGHIKYSVSSIPYQVRSSRGPYSVSSQVQ